MPQNNRNNEDKPKEEVTVKGDHMQWSQSEKDGWKRWKEEQGKLYWQNQQDS